MLHFDPDTGFYADDTETVRAAVAADWVAAFHKDGQVDLNTKKTRSCFICAISLTRQKTRAFFRMRSQKSIF